MEKTIMSTLQTRGAVNYSQWRSNVVRWRLSVGTEDGAPKLQCHGKGREQPCVFVCAQLDLLDRSVPATTNLLDDWKLQIGNRWTGKNLSLETDLDNFDMAGYNTFGDYILQQKLLANDATTMIILIHGKGP